MKIVFPILLLLLAGCNNGTTPAEVKLQMSDRIATLRAVNYGAIEADVSFHGEEAQVVVFTGNATQSVVIDNIILDAINYYEVKWYEIVDNERLQLSIQKGEFFANSATMSASIDAEHNTDMDYNHNGLTNLEDRQAGNCAWVACNTRDGMLRPNEINTVIGFPDTGFSMVRGEGLSWIETTPDGTFNWTETLANNTMIYMEDSDRGHLL